VTTSDRAAKLTALRAICATLLTIIGEDPDRPGLQGTPDRWARWWLEFLDGGEPHGPAALTTFPAEGADQMVVVSGMRVWSLCEHHLLPFYCDLTMAVIPGDRLLGLSKFARIARRQARHLQVQERLVEQIANALADATGSPSVAVVGRGEHLCMSMRGVKEPEHRMTTSVIRGVFRDKGPAREELFHLAGLR
jgi:GTP cyclohydrolase I